MRETRSLRLVSVLHEGAGSLSFLRSRGRWTVWIFGGGVGEDDEVVLVSFW